MACQVPATGAGASSMALSELAAKDSLSEADQQQVKQSVDSLMDSFGAVDERLHGGDDAGKSYS